MDSTQICFAHLLNQFSPIWGEKRANNINSTFWDLKQFKLIILFYHSKTALRGIEKLSPWKPSFIIYLVITICSMCCVSLINTYFKMFNSLGFGLCHNDVYREVSNMSKWWLQPRQKRGGALITCWHCHLDFFETPVDMPVSKNGLSLQILALIVELHLGEGQSYCWIQLRNGLIPYNVPLPVLV